MNKKNSGKVVGIRGNTVTEDGMRMNAAGIEELEKFLEEVKKGQIVNAFWCGTGDKGDYNFGWAIETQPGLLIGETELALSRLKLTVMEIEDSL